MRCVALLIAVICGYLAFAPLPGALGEQDPWTIPQIDLADRSDLQTTVDRQSGQYLGHPTTVLLEDGKTMIAVYPKGHGRGAIVMRRSSDGGRTWSDRLPTPASWETSLETPTLFRTIDPQGTRRLVLFSGLYPIRMAVGNEHGTEWSELAPIGDFGGIVAMSELVQVAGGDYLALFHDDGRFFRGSGKVGPMVVYSSRSEDGGLSWDEPRAIASLPQAQLCEPGAVRSADGKQIAVLLRENSRRFPSYLIVSDDEGETWSEPRPLPSTLTGDRHQAIWTHDGRLLISFRDMGPKSPTKGDWVAWVGTYDDLLEGKEGAYRVRLMDNTKGTDCAYPALEKLPDETIVATTYGHWVEGEAPFIVALHFRIEDLDALVAKKVAEQ